MATAGDQINGALRLIGQLAEAETPSAATSQDALTAMNQMLDSWSTERLTVFCTQDQMFTWPANLSFRTIGTTGDFVGNRPVKLDDATYFKDPTSDISYQVKIINQEQYNNIALKTSTSTFPQFVYVNMTNPNAEIRIWPVPTMDLEWHFVSVAELAQVPTLNTELVFPPGYSRAFKFNLACEIAAEFGVEASPTVKRIAMVSKRNIKRINNPMDVMGMPNLLVYNRWGYNIYSGDY